MRHAIAAEIQMILQDRADELRRLIGSQAAFALPGNGGSLVVQATLPAEYTVEMEVDDETIEIPVQVRAMQSSPLQAAVSAAIARSANLQSVVTDLLQQVEALQTRVGCFNGPCQRFAAILAI